MIPKDYFESNEISEDDNYVFVLLAEESEEVYKEYVKKAVNSLGLKCESFLDIKLSGDAIKHVWKGIQTAGIIIVDITGFSPNVMYELGTVLTVRNAENIIVIYNKSHTKEKLPFNISHIETLYYYNDKFDALKNELTFRLEDILRRIFGIISDPVKDFDAKTLTNDAIQLGKDKNKNPISSETLFREADSKEPKNWYILYQWGIMYRNHFNYSKADEKFNHALDCVHYNEDRSLLYVERAILCQMTGKKMEEVEDWFQKAKDAYHGNKSLYIAWSKFYAETGMYEKAISTVKCLLDEIDPHNEEAQLRENYYNKKLSDPNFNSSFEEYAKEIQAQTEKPAEIPSKEIEIPWNITWEELEKNAKGSIVEGLVRKITDIGIFVELSRDFVGLLYHKNLASSYKEQFFINQPIKVKIEDISVSPENGGKRIGLSLVER